MPKSEDTKKKRPSFSAPTPPDPEAVVINSEEEVAENTTSEPIDSKPATPTPPKFITKGGPDKESNFGEIIKDETQEPASSQQSNEPVEEVNLDEEEYPTPESTEPEAIIEITSESNTSQSTGKLIKIILLLLIILVGIVGWVMYFSAQNPNLFSSINLGGTPPSPTPTTTPVPPSPTPVDRSVVSIQILNGSGVSGAAAATAETLEGIGYTITGTGNADNSDYQATEIYTTPNFPENLTDILLADLTKEYGSASISGELDTLPGEANTRIILGTDWTSGE
jgi:hypothetical protein